MTIEVNPMAHIVVDEAQAKIISESSGDIEIRDRHGKRLGFVAHSFTDVDIAIAKKRLSSTEPRYTTPEVLRHLESLEKK
jgi:hypothetical protein